MSARSLDGKVVVVTGVSRRAGIGFAVAQRLLRDGARVLIHSWRAHDAEQPWGADTGGMAAVVDDLGGVGERLQHIEADFQKPSAPRRVIEDACARFGGIDALVANHARSSLGTLDRVDAEELDRAWAVNARSVVLLVQAFAACHDNDRGPGSVVLFTSGQHLGPMPEELPYAISKGAVHQMTNTLADALAPRAISLNAINPGPVDTGWASADLHSTVSQRFPTGRWSTPADTAAVVRWLVDQDASRITGQVIDAEAGFRRS